MFNFIFINFLLAYLLTLNYLFSSTSSFFFRLCVIRPKNKFIRITSDENFSSELHYLSSMPAMAEAACAYDMDQVDEAWLRVLNGDRAMAGFTNVSEEQFERVIEELEVKIIYINLM